MEWLALIALGIWLYTLWQRMGRIERRIDALDRFVTEPRPSQAHIGPVRPPVAQEEMPPEPSRSAARIVHGTDDLEVEIVPELVEAVPAASPATPSRRFSFDFEVLFGRLLPIWAGGVTLAVAGLFVVRLAIDAGLFTPVVRVVLGFCFGVVLVGAAEAAHRFRERVADPRVAQALCGAGLATHYACFFLAGQIYGLIGAGVAFVGLAGVTAAAIVLSYRFGLPSAVLALIGGFAAPALVGGEEANLPLLSLYLALVSAGLADTGRRQERSWLGPAAIACGLIWGALMLLTGQIDAAGTISLGLYLALQGTIMPALSASDARWSGILRAGSAVVASLLMAVLIERGGFAPLIWGLYALIGAALAFLAWHMPQFRPASVFAALLAVWMLGFWPLPESWHFIAVALPLTAIFAGVPLAQVWRLRALGADIVQLAVFATGMFAVILFHFADDYGVIEPLVAMAGLALASMPALALSRLAIADEPAPRWWNWPLEAAAALLAYGAVGKLLPVDALPWLAAVGGVAVAMQWRDRWAAQVTLLFISACWAIDPISDWLTEGLPALAGEPMLASALSNWTEATRSLLPVAVFAGVLVWRQAPRLGRLTGSGCGMVGCLSLVTVHIVYKQLFSIADAAAFVTYGLAERTVWEGMLLFAAAGIALAADQAERKDIRRAAIITAALALAHFGWFTGLIHNPLLNQQAVGPWPLLNWLLPAYGIAMAALVWLRGEQKGRYMLAFDAALMAAIAVFSLSELRQFFAGTILVSPAPGQAEELLRSLAGIVIALGYLGWGARTSQRSWRIGSLVLMLFAVAKVFLLDAAGLDGFARIASFLALGISLIGIGWFYTRQLKAIDPQAGKPVAGPAALGA